MTTKTLLWAALFLAFAGQVQAQKRTIDHPSVDFSNTGVQRIVRVEADGTSTRVHLLNEFIPGWWVNFPPQTFLEDEATGGRYTITGMEGGEIDQHLTMPASGDSLVVLIFPPLPPEVKKVNFGELDETLIYGIALEKPRGRRPEPTNAVPADIQAWMEEALGDTAPAGIKPFDAPDFFGHGTAHVIGYIRGYDPRAGFDTGIVHMSNIVTGESAPVTFDIDPDGRFIAEIPLIHPQKVQLAFKNHGLPLYVEQGGVLGVVFDWEDFLSADRYRDRRYTFQKTRYFGSLGELNRELWSFEPERIRSSADYQKMQEQTAAMSPMEVVAFHREVRDRNLAALEAIKNTISDDAYRLLRYAEFDYFGYQVADYEMNYTRTAPDEPQKPPLPVEFYGFLKEIPLDDPGLLTAGEWVFQNRFEFMAPLIKARQSVNLYLSFDRYLVEKKGIAPTAEILEFQALSDSINNQLQRGVASDDLDSLLMLAAAQKGKEMTARHAAEYEEYMAWQQAQDNTPSGVTRREFQSMDSVYQQVLGLSPSLFYDLGKVHSLRNRQGLSRSEQLAVSRVVSDAVNHPFLKDEVWRLFEASLPEAGNTSGYDLPPGAGSEAFKAIVDRFQGELVLVDLWATTCGPCIAHIRSSKEQRKALEASGKLTYVFITEDRQSPQEAYDQFVAEQEMTNTFRVDRDDWNRFMQLFKFSGIPHYVLVGKDGRILDDQFTPYINLEQAIEKYE